MFSPIRQTAGGVLRRKIARESVRSVSSCNKDGVYELRTYDIVPGKLGELSELIKEHFHLRTNHSELIGFWSAEIGALNQVIHCWHYDSLSHRASVRAALANDKDWLSIFVSKAKLTWQAQENRLMLPIEGVNTSQPTDKKGVYEMETIRLPGSLNDHQDKLTEYLGSGDSPPVGAWRTVLGDLHSVTLLHHHQNIDSIVRRRKLNTGESLQAVSSHWQSKLLLPHPVSPLQ